MDKKEMVGWTMICISFCGALGLIVYVTVKAFHLGYKDTLIGLGAIAFVVGWCRLADYLIGN